MVDGVQIRTKPEITTAVWSTGGDVLVGGTHKGIQEFLGVGNGGDATIERQRTARHGVCRPSDLGGEESLSSSGSKFWLLVDKVLCGPIFTVSHAVML